MKDVNFYCDAMDGQACVQVFVGNIGKCAYYPCEGKEAFLESIEYLDAKGELLLSLHNEVSAMLRSLEDAKKVITAEREKCGLPISGIKVGDLVDVKPGYFGVCGEVVEAKASPGGTEWIWVGKGASAVCVPACKYDVVE